MKPELWEPIIRRCVVQERHALLGAINAVLRQPGSAPVARDEELDRWHEAGKRAFLESVAKDPQADLLSTGHYLFSYRVNTTESEHLEVPSLVDELRKMGREVQELVNSGWTMFTVLNDTRLGAVTDEAAGDGEILQCRTVGGNRTPLGELPDFWRISPAGFATVARPFFFEDMTPLWSQDAWRPGTWLWPFGVTSDLVEIIRHARAFSERFVAPESVSFRMEWRGLRGRVLRDPANPMVALRSSKMAGEDGLAATTHASVAELADDWRTLAARMASRVLRAFDVHASVSAEMVEAWAKNAFRG